MKHAARKISTRIRRGQPEILQQLVQAVRDVRSHRQMNAAEPPETQDAWDRLQMAVLIAERSLAKRLDKRHR